MRPSSHLDAGAAAAVGFGGGGGSCRAGSLGGAWPETDVATGPPSMVWARAGVVVLLRGTGTTIVLERRKRIFASAVEGRRTRAASGMASSFFMAPPCRIFR
jgi:hypothetical protein